VLARIVISKTVGEIVNEFLKELGFVNLKIVDGMANCVTAIIVYTTIHYWRLVLVLLWKRQEKRSG
jgi:hypothetical protein